MDKGNGPSILVVEDHVQTAKVVKRVLEETDSGISAEIVRDGSDCLEVLRGEADTVDDPDMVLLDLDLLTVDGLTVLETRKGESGLQQVPIVVVSGTDDSETIARCYACGANTFISKPDDLEGYLAFAETLIDYWGSLAELPSGRSAA